MKVSTLHMHALRGHLKCKYQNNENEEYLELMGDAKNEPFKKGEKKKATPKTLRSKSPSSQRKPQAFKKQNPK